MLNVEREEQEVIESDDKLPLESDEQNDSKESPHSRRGLGEHSINTSINLGD